MAFIKIKNIKIRGNSVYVPSKITENINLKCYASKEEATEAIKATGIERRHVINSDTTVSDLCLKATKSLIESLGRKRVYWFIGFLYSKSILC